MALKKKGRIPVLEGKRNFQISMFSLEIVPLLAFLPVEICGLNGCGCAQELFFCICRLVGGGHPSAQGRLSAAAQPERVEQERDRQGQPGSLLQPPLLEVRTDTGILSRVIVQNLILPIL